MPDIAESLRDAARRNGMTQARLADAAGVSPRTLTHVFSGQEDYRVSTLMALANRLGLELVLLPKGAGAGLAVGEPAGPPVRSVINEALEAAQARRDAATRTSGR
ncbi:helix-turn-helix transcriptional regulator [Mitsuaria sp. GD03876]|uniref:helix-turn-helix domain-containing protein n=1 Tax=Mitsuaria sp. GD03876 TaxID=2975399 RepID=UPI0024499548|nr:helix-turn-helix transcriptional regulator [Mitsuaria sp. GD03876]MDH0866101.1 helix-turn-helix domain-containing protein [Mitsuaria sp. GD03876]